MKIIHLICAARPNFMKVAPLFHVLTKESWCDVKIVHTGQHYDLLLSDVFFDQFRLPQPNHSLNVGSGSHAEQTGKTMMAYEQLCQTYSPDLCIVVGDVNATLACTLSAKKCFIPVAHVEAGLRSFDRTMPEEINRVVVDRLCDLHLTPSEDADFNLSQEGIPKDSIKLVGNIMIDSLEMMRSNINQSLILSKLGLENQNYSVMTLHRPANVDHLGNLEEIFLQLQSCYEKKFIFPVHPRTRKVIEGSSLSQSIKNIHLIDPLPYIDFIRLVMDSQFVLTDSGGMQEETSYLGIPCLTLRTTTERPITITHGTNQLVSLENLGGTIHKMNFNTRKPAQIPFWDGKTSERIVPIIKDFLRIQ